MDIIVKRRLIGALVIVLLAIILVPMWFDGEARRLRDEDAFVAPLPPVDNRQAVIELESIGEQIQVKAPSLEPLPEVAKQAVEEPKKIVKEPVRMTRVIKPVADVIPAPVEVNLNVEARDENTRGIDVDIAQSVHTQANWIVQVGSFSSRRNAEKMVIRLKNGGLKAFMREFKSNGDSIFRVLVGPFVRQAEANSAKRTIDREFKVKSFVSSWRG